MLFCSFIFLWLLNCVTATPTKAYLLKDNIGDDILIETVPSLKLFKSDEHKFYHVGTSAQVTWFQALLFCKNYNMELVSIETQEEDTVLWRNIRTIYPNTNTQYWFWTSGITHPPPAGNCAWAGTGHPMTYTDWAAGQPANTGCIAVLLYQQNHDWRIAPCAQGGLAFPICETSLPQSLADAISNHQSCNLTLIQVDSN